MTEPLILTELVAGPDMDAIDRAIIAAQKKPLPPPRLRPLDSRIVVENKVSWWGRRLPGKVKIIRRSLIDTGRGTAVLTEIEHRFEML